MYQLIYEDYISSEILSGSTGAFFSELLKQTVVVHPHHIYFVLFGNPKDKLKF